MKSAEGGSLTSSVSMTLTLVICFFYKALSAQDDSINSRVSNVYSMTLRLVTIFSLRIHCMIRMCVLCRSLVII